MNTGPRKLHPGPRRGLRQIVARQYVLLTEAPSTKPQATSPKLQAPSFKQPDQKFFGYLPKTEL